MGYEVFITRAQSWAENQGLEITRPEWESLISTDPELRIDDENGPDYAIWLKHPSNSEAWICWRGGSISTKNPDAPLLRKMRDVASRLKAHLQDEDGESFPDECFVDDISFETQSPRSSLREPIAIVSLALSTTFFATVSCLTITGTANLQGNALRAPGMQLVAMFALLIAFGGVFSIPLALWGFQSTGNRTRWAWITIAMDALAFLILVANR
ncbi:hypothetical protein Pan44_05710 [Caulifigura coniformis]|uniref:Uncharacterized protein n=1 Tax=Caulifigura coniformis TaxID=2527983 RepID=A0A517S8X1_9PLAN|nr:hypothetical protein [Caulifigura coniformis]QDT52559.1 hypothetical protein Pan44_05710 [Caulifigura coniformis]